MGAKLRRPPNIQFFEDIEPSLDRQIVYDGLRDVYPLAPEILVMHFTRASLAAQAATRGALRVINLYFPWPLLIPVIVCLSTEKEFIIWLVPP